MESEDEIETAILDYLAERPEAADTIIGIADWWLRLHQTKVTVPKLRRVLNRLTHKGVLETVGHGERMCYRLKR